MKKPLFNQYDRMIIREDNTLLSAFIKLYIHLKKMERKIINKIIAYSK
jgi:hypothetical protein